MKKLHIKTFGCQMNAYDSGRLARLLERRCGFAQVDDPLSADLIIFNTCHIREKAEEKLFSELGRIRKGLAGRRVTLAVGGCVAQAEGEAIFRRAPFVDLVFGPQNIHRLPEMLDALARAGGRQTRTGAETEPKFDALADPAASGPGAMVTVQEGCDRFCAYCVVPATRGREWSRPVEEVLAEVRALAKQGAVEITLLGQNVNAYRGLDADGATHDLALLLRQAALIDGVERLRFVTSHPADMSDDLVELFGDLPELCPYLHLPIQSGSDRILTAMARGHAVADYLAWVEKLRRVQPRIALASDFIVGFPGETEADFAQTLELVSRVGFDHAYSFKFSARPGTAAAGMDGQVPEAIKSERLARLQARINAEQLARNRAQEGRVVPVLVEGITGRRAGELMGRAPDARRVHFPGDAGLIGHTARVRIVEGLPNSLRGQPL